MSKPPKRPRDANQLAKAIVDIATGEADKKAPRKNAVQGGIARATALTPQQRAEIAKVAADARWKKAN